METPSRPRLHCLPRTVAWAVCIGVAAACSSAPPPPAVEPVLATPPSVPEQTVVDTVTVLSPELELELAGLQVRLLEKEAQIAELERKVGDAIQEAVRAMAKLQSLASKAEAASGMAEAEVALEALRSAAGAESPSEVTETERLLEMSAKEFGQQNYGGSLYLANEARSIARTAQRRFQTGEETTLQPGELLFALPLNLQTTRNSNVRSGPGVGYKVLFTLASGTPLIAYSYKQKWMHVRDQDGRDGWIFHSLVNRRREAESP